MIGFNVYHGYTERIKCFQPHQQAERETQEDI